MSSRKGSIVSKAVPASDSGLKNIERFRTKTVPAVGATVREQDRGIEQISFDV